MRTPIKKFCAGAVSAALWENEAKVNGKPVAMLKVTVDRRYKDKQTGEWRSANSFSRTDLPLVQYCLTKAFEAMIEMSKSDDDQRLQVEEEVVVA